LRLCWSRRWRRIGVGWLSGLAVVRWVCLLSRWFVTGLISLEWLGSLLVCYY
jgi:hypothetical protein